jgi:sugar fermentation stimulation protein
MELDEPKMKYKNTRRAKFLDRPNRFIANVELDGQKEIVHVKNTGRCKEIFVEGTTVILEEATNPNRKTKYSLIGGYKDGLLINTDSQVPNAVVYDALQENSIIEVKNVTYVKREVTFGNSRFDIYFEKENIKGFIEVKGVTLEYDGVCMFPDAPTERGTKHIVKSELIDKQLREDFGIPKGKDIIAHSKQPEVQTPEDLPILVEKLKNITGGVPIGAKIGAGKYLEKDLEYLCKSGVDFITVDGAEAATKGSPPIFQDDFGIPTVFAIHRAAKWIRDNGYADRISLIVSGKIRTPGEVLKARALGADACYMGSIALFAVSHSQLKKALPFEPPTSLVWYNAHYSKSFDISKGAKSLNNFLESCHLEIADGVRGLGKTSLMQVNKDDLIAIDETVAKGCGIPMAYHPYEF